jgi:hypothetical protein
MPDLPMSNIAENIYEPQGADNFQTPRYAVDLLVPFIPSNITGIWEPACGEGRIVKALYENKYNVLGTDLKFGPNYNFLLPWYIMSFPEPDNTAIITNPPFSLKKKFYNMCMSYGLAFALLIPSNFCSWIIDAFRYDHCQAIIPSRRINFVTPTGKQGKDSSAKFHSMWLTYDFHLPEQFNFVELEKKDMENI